MLSLSGCFIVPVLDGRSPFDSISNHGTQETKDAAVELDELINTQVDLGTDWRVEAVADSDNCEGPCDYHLRVNIYTTATNDMPGFKKPRYDDKIITHVNFPESELVEVLEVAIPFAVENEFDLAISVGCDYSQDFDTCGSITHILEPLGEHGSGTKLDTRNESGEWLGVKW